MRSGARPGKVRRGLATRSGGDEPPAYIASLNFQLQQEKHQADALKEAVRKVVAMVIMIMK